MGYVTGFTVIKVKFYHAPPFSTLILTNQLILTFKNGSVVIMALCKPHLEVRSLVLVWVDMTPPLMMMKRLLKKVTIIRRNNKDLHIPLR